MYNKKHLLGTNMAFIYLWLNGKNGHVPFTMSKLFLYFYLVILIFIDHPVNDFHKEYISKYSKLLMQNY